MQDVISTVLTDPTAREAATVEDLLIKQTDLASPWSNTSANG